MSRLVQAVLRKVGPHELTARYIAACGTDYCCCAAKEQLNSQTHVFQCIYFAPAVTELLGNGADPCARDARGRTAYGVAGSKEVRDAFRRAMAAAPDRWDWGAAEVPSALTEDLEAAQAAKKVRLCVCVHVCVHTLEAVWVWVGERAKTGGRKSWDSVCVFQYVCMHQVFASVRCVQWGKGGGAWGAVCVLCLLHTSTTSEGGFVALSTLSQLEKGLFCSLYRCCGHNRLRRRHGKRPGTPSARLAVTSAKRWLRQQPRQPWRMRLRRRQQRQLRWQQSG